MHFWFKQKYSQKITGYINKNGSWGLPAVASLQCPVCVSLHVCVRAPLTAPPSTAAACCEACVSGTRGGHCCCGGAVVLSQETAVASATPALARTSSSAPPEPTASPPGTASPAPGPRSASGLLTGNKQMKPVCSSLYLNYTTIQIELIWGGGVIIIATEKLSDVTQVKLCSWMI